MVEGLGKSGAAKNARVIVEKPFGRDLASAQELNRVLHTVFPEPSIFRIDHYLGKEPVQNLLYFRFANSFLEPIWNRNYVESVADHDGRGLRRAGPGKFYEEVGALRDVVQNHLLQTTAILAMEPPVGCDRRGAARREGEGVPGDAHADARPTSSGGSSRATATRTASTPDSDVETFAAVRVHIDSWRWEGVPFFIRAGKELPITATEVMVEFRRPPQQVFADDELDPDDANYMRFRLGPDQRRDRARRPRSKVPGESFVGEPVELYLCNQGADEAPAYERLLGDAMEGKALLFAREDGVEQAWRVVDPVLTTTAPPTRTSSRPGGRARPTSSCPRASSGTTPPAVTRPVVSRCDQRELWLARHGETEWTTTLQHTSTTDVPLTEVGEEQARALGAMLGDHEFALVLSSPMRRALETARLAGFGDRVEIDDDLVEWDYGDYEGRTTADIREERPGWTLWDDGVPMGEIPEQVAARTRRVIDRATQGRRRRPAVRPRARPAHAHRDVAGPLARGRPAVRVGDRDAERARPRAGGPRHPAVEPAGGLTRSIGAVPVEPVPTPNAPPVAGPYSPAVRAGDWFVLAGQVGLDPATGKLAKGGGGGEARQAMANIATVLGDCGASLADVAKTTVFLIAMNDFVAVNEAYAEAFGDHRPARSTVQVAALPAGARVEIEVWAFRPE